MGRTKIIDLSGRSFLDGGESRITPLVYSDEYHAYEPDTRKISKTAACDEALNYASGVSPAAGKRVILVSAVGDYESWGDNKKGDVFPLKALMGESPADKTIDFFSKYSHKIPGKYGYQCFVTKFDESGNQIGGGNTFHEHLNRFPSNFLGKPVFDKTSGKVTPFRGDTRCGYILAAFWNDKMHRVELIQEVWEDKLPAVVRSIDEGHLPGISMACDIPFDRCSVCGNLAASEMQYCSHLNRRSGMRGAILGSGTPVVMINDFPVFFDSSIVRSPAAVEGRTLFKVASTTAQETHTNALDAELPADVPRAREAFEKRLQAMRLEEVPFSTKVASELRHVPLSRLVSYLGTVGIAPTCEDLGNLMLDGPILNKQAGQLAEFHLLDVLNNQVMLEAPSRYLKPKIKYASEEKFDPDEYSFVLKKVAGYIPLKSYLSDYLAARPINKQAGLMIDVSKPLSHLDDRTRMLLLTKIMMDKELIAHLRSLFQQPSVKWELENRGLSGIYNNSDLSPVYGGRASSYIDVMSRARPKFYT